MIATVTVASAVTVAVTMAVDILGTCAVAGYGCYINCGKERNSFCDHVCYTTFRLIVRIFHGGCIPQESGPNNICWNDGTFKFRRLKDSRKKCLENLEISNSQATANALKL